MRRRHLVLFGVLACAVPFAAPAPAGAAFFAGEAIDGPSPDIRSLGALDVARDGSGAVAYVRRDGGVDHIFVSRLISGVWQPPERVDAGLAAAGSDPVVAASEGGRLAIAYVSGGQLFAVVRPAGAPGFTAPALIASSGSNPAIDMSIQGVAYLSFTAPGVSPADVRVARLDRHATTFALLADTLDIVPAQEAGAGAGGRSRIAVSADGTAVVTWGEVFGDGRMHVIARRVFGDRISAAPQDLTLDTFNGHAGGSADSPEIDIEDDSSYAWVVYRQMLDDGHAHAIARRLVGSAFDPPVVIDPFGVPATADAGTPHIAMNGTGQGIATVGGSSGFETIESFLRRNVFAAPARLDAGNSVDPLPLAGVAETGDGVVAWQQRGPGETLPTIHARFFDDQPAASAPPPAGPDTLVSNGALGPTEADQGFGVASNRAGDVVIAYVQGGDGARRIVAATYDRPPGQFRGSTTTKFRRFARPRLAWLAAFDLWGPVTYSIFIDGKPDGQTTETSAIVPFRVADGKHLWRVVATDRRGQSVSSPSRLMRVDATKPLLSVTVGGKRRRGAIVRVSTRARDVLNPLGSGIRFVRISFGDGSPVLTAAAAVHRYAHSGSFTLKVSATDKAGNVAVVNRRIRVKK